MTCFESVCVHVCVCALTGASPGHSYTVKSPPTSSSSDVTSVSWAFCSVWLLQGGGNGAQAERSEDVVGTRRSTR